MNGMSRKAERYNAGTSLPCVRSKTHKKTLQNSVYKAPEKTKLRNILTSIAMWGFGPFCNASKRGSHGQLLGRKSSSDRCSSISTNSAFDCEDSNNFTRDAITEFVLDRANPSPPFLLNGILSDLGSNVFMKFSTETTPCQLSPKNVIKTKAHWQKCGKWSWAKEKGPKQKKQMNTLNIWWTGRTGLCQGRHARRTASNKIRTWWRIDKMTREDRLNLWFTCS